MVALTQQMDRDAVPLCMGDKIRLSVSNFGFEKRHRRPSHINGKTQGRSSRIAGETLGSC